MAKKINTFKKEQLVRSRRFAYNRDLVDAILEDGKEYTIEDVEQKIKKYLKGKVV